MFGRYLYGFEDYCASTGIAFRMDLPYKTGEVKAEVKAEETAGASNNVSMNAEKEPETSNTRLEVRKHPVAVIRVR